MIRIELNLKSQNNYLRCFTSHIGEIHYLASHGNKTLLQKRHLDQ